MNKQAAVVDVAGIAGVHEAVDHVLGVAVGVALEQERAATKMRPDAPGARLAVVFVEERELGAAWGRPAVAGAARRSAGDATETTPTSVDP